MAAVTLDGGWLEVNDRLCEILGYPKEELLRKNWMDLSHPRRPGDGPAPLQAARFGRCQSLHKSRNVNVRKDGSTVCTMIAVQAFYREDGAVDCVNWPHGGHYRQEAGRGGPEARTGDPQALAAIQRPRTANDRL